MLGGAAVREEGHASGARFRSGDHGLTSLCQGSRPLKALVEADEIGTAQQDEGKGPYRRSTNGLLGRGWAW
eukprot:365130-Chlamydomonas_euryale.AAC.1